MPGHGEKHSRKREQAIAALLSEPTVEGAAKKAKVGYKTLCLWLKEPEFNREYREARWRIVEGAISRLQQTMIMAVLTLHRNLTCGQPATEVRAAQIILEQSVTVSEDGAYHVPKKELVTGLLLLLQGRQLKVARSLRDADALVQELEFFRVKLTAAANETFGADRTGQHDDLVLAVVLACWQAERGSRWHAEEISFGDDVVIGKAPPGVFLS